MVLAKFIKKTLELLFLPQTKNKIRKREQVEKEAACQARYKEFYMLIVALDNKHSKTMTRRHSEHINAKKRNGSLSSVCITPG